MPKALPMAERLRRARTLIEEGDAITLPAMPGDHARSSAIARKRSKYYNARKAIGLMLNAGHRPTPRRKRSRKRAA